MTQNVSGTIDYWKKQAYNLMAMKDFMERKRGEGRGHPNFFLTLTINESWPEVQAFVRGKAKANPNVGSSPLDLPISRGGQSAVLCVTAVTVAAQKRFRFVMQQIREKKPLGEVEEYFVRAEYQNRGAIHWHILLWCKENTIPPDAVVAFFPDENEYTGGYWDKHRERVFNYQTHKCMIGKCIKQKGGKCKLGFPFPVNHTKKVDDNGIRYLYVRKSPRDGNIVPYNHYILEWLDAHMNIQEVNNTHWIDYLVKYTTKIASYHVKIRNQRDQSKDKFMLFRDISKMESVHNALQFPSVECSREVFFLPTELDPDFRALKRKEQLELLDPESTDVFMQSKLDFYLNRPSEFENVSYANYYRHYDISYNLNKAGAVRDPTNPKRVIFRRSDEHEAVVRWYLKILMKDPADFAFQQLILHVPFREKDGSDLFSPENIDKNPLRECLIRLEDEQERYSEIQFGNEREMALHFLETSKSKGMSLERLITFVNDLTEHGYLKTEFAKHYVEELKHEFDNKPQPVFEQFGTLVEPEDDLDDPIYPSQTTELIVNMYQHGTEGQKVIFQMFDDWAKGEKQLKKQKLAKGETYVKSQKLVFISGGAGTGKTYLLKALMAGFRYWNVPYRTVA